MTDLEEMDEEEMLMRAITMSLEEKEEREEEEREGRDVTEEELESIKIQGSGELLQIASGQSTAKEVCIQLDTNFQPFIWCR